MSKQDKPDNKASGVASKNKELLSTTQLAKQLDLPLKKLFALLNESTWITRTNDQWQLTGKGEFEGGQYKTHSKYGQYIVWPTSVVNHRLFKQLIQHNEGSTHSATAIAKSLSSELNKARSDKQKGKESESTDKELKQHISAKRLNAIFFELGWIEKAKGGWQPTAIGKELGGETHSNDKTGVPFVLWPKALQHNAYLKHSIQVSFPSQEEKTDHICLDGHSHNNPALSQIDNWLYHAGLLHAINRPLPLQKTKQELKGDFYLPSHHIHIEYWGYDKTPAYLKQKLAKQDWYKQHGLRLIELTAGDLSTLDEVLPKALLEFGVEV